jgi:hypothetical protein
MAPVDPLPSQEDESEVKKDAAIGKMVRGIVELIPWKYLPHALLVIMAGGWGSDHFLFRPTSSSQASAVLTPESIERMNRTLDAVDSKMNKFSDILLKNELRQDAIFATLPLAEQAQVKKIYAQSMAALDTKSEINGVRQ